MGDAVATDAGGIDTVVADGGMGAGDAARAGRASIGEPLSSGVVGGGDRTVLWSFGVRPESRGATSRP